MNRRHFFGALASLAAGAVGLRTTSLLSTPWPGIERQYCHVCASRGRDPWACPDYGYHSTTTVTTSTTCTTYADTCTRPYGEEIGC